MTHVDPVHPVADPSTRDRVLELIMSDGPISAAELAERLDLTSAAIRRHLSGLEGEQLVAVHESGHTGLRGRPARRYVATVAAQGVLSAGYPEIALQALEYLARAVGTDGVEAFAQDRLDETAARYARHMTADDVQGRVDQLAAALHEDGFAPSVRPVAGTTMVQLCQGHCPVAHVAARFPQLCDAETRLFSRMLGTHVQRLATLAGGGHVCTTNIPVGAWQPHPPPPSPAEQHDHPTSTHHRPHSRSAEGSP